MKIWTAVALLFGVLLVWAEHSRSLLDDPDPARQRIGQLTPTGASTRAPPNIPGFPRPGHRLVVLFARSVDGQMLFHDLAMQSDLTVVADVVLVTEDGSHPTITNGLSVILPDRDGSIVAAYGLHRPIDGGYPIGYAIVDSQGLIRFQTLDAHCLMVMHMNREMVVILRAAP